ncbi:MAG: cation diffusion facilitator family transporter [Nanoarchaeota archaeon]
MEKSKKITIWGIILNSILFIAKLTVGLISNSLAVLSDAFNSLTDIVSSIGIFIAVKISNKKADSDHPFGHHRAEPLAGIIVAILAGILGFEIIRTAIENLIDHKAIIIGNSAIIVLLFTIIVKLFMSYHFIRQGKELRSPAIKACGIDSRNDVFVSSIALLGVVATKFGFVIFDDIAAFIIGLFIIYSGYKIGVENIDYLMGKSPPEEYIRKIIAIVKRIKGVKGLNSIKAHYVGSLIHIEIHIEVNKKLSTQGSHEIGENVRKKVEKLIDVDKAFIHIDPR